ncbi:F-box protein DOR-like [Raphanus sativus]|uniref:F-box protein DOR-like n=1 Tax=Raphanus sativus TaxID=3726 RepID=A0A6J0LRI6_RAPSA|nr:F-box protein DOR-like [Raphanus sativus]
MKSRLDAEEFSSMIPIELITIEIFSRLPLKSIARCRCVSKRWASILGRQDFTDLFFTKSLARPKLLFASHKGSEILFFSSPQLSLGSETVTVTSTSFEMWILVDPEKHEWSKRFFNLPPMWIDPAAEEFIRFVGVTATNEFVFLSSFTFAPFYAYYYNFAKEDITGFEIQGMGAFERGFPILIGLNHVEDVKLMAGASS